MGVPIRTLLDGCAGVNSIPEEAVLGALNLAKQKGLKASDPSFPVVQLERWKRKEVITGVRKDALMRVIVRQSCASNWSPFRVSQAHRSS